MDNPADTRMMAPPRKIGIITHHYVNNFGAFLQLYALYRILKEMFSDATVEVVDFRVKPHYFLNRRKLYLRKMSWKNFNTDLRRWVDEIRLANIYRKERGRLKFSKPIFTAEAVNSLQYDAIIIGSDEVWHFNDSAYSSVKFGYGLTALKSIAYAPSIGGAKLDSPLPTSAISGLNNLTHISVRDSNTAALVRRYTGKDAQLVLDPTFLYDFEPVQLPDCVGKNTYLLCYFEGTLDRKLICIIKDYCKALQWKVVGVGCAAPWYDTCLVDINPLTWAALFKHAAMVISGTFHGTVFGLKYGKKVIACPDTRFVNRQEKIRSLLNDLEVMGCYLDLQSLNSPDLLQRNFYKTWEPEKTMATVDEKKRISRNFLYNALSAETEK